MANTAFYIFTLTAGYLALLMSGLWMSRLYRHNLMEDVFNMENESFMQETRLMENEYSVNLPTRFYYKKRWNNGFVNIVNIFRACMVIGTPGSGKFLYDSQQLRHARLWQRALHLPPSPKLQVLMTAVHHSL